MSSKAKKVFIDGREGTTGLRIFERLCVRPDIDLIILAEEQRKDFAYRREALNSCDIAFLCLPDEAASQAANAVSEPGVKIIDASTAHRTSDGWAYGFPELSEKMFSAVRDSKRVAVPGCHASGFAALVYPLIENGVLSAKAELVCHSVTGYSGGGKKMIAEYTGQEKNLLLDAPRQYGLSQQHKHLKEMRHVSGLASPPVFCPIVSDFYSGMVVTVPLFASNLSSGYHACDLREIYASLYNGPVVRYLDDPREDGYISASGMAGCDGMQVFVSGNDDRILLIARFDNLGKGASGAAIECMNIMTGTDLTTGLVL